jgi:hypothetical protein
MGGDSNQINKIFIECHKCHGENKTRDVTVSGRRVAGGGCCFKRCFRLLYGGGELEGAQVEAGD